MGARGRRAEQRGFGLIEIVIVLVVVALAGALLMKYVGSTQKTVETLQQERPVARARLAADQATLDSIQGLVRNYQAEHDGTWPPDKATVVGLLIAPPKFQCAGNDFAYDPATGALRLLITDPARC